MVGLFVCPAALGEAPDKAPVAELQSPLAAAELAAENEDWPEAARLYALALDELPDSDRLDRQRLDTLEALADIYLFRLQQSRDALPRYEEAVAIRRRLGSTTGSRAVETWSHLGHIYHSLKAYGKALELARDVAQREESEHGAEAPELVPYLLRLGSLTQKVHPADPELEQILRRAVDLSYGGSLEWQQDALTAMARHYQQQEEYASAATYYHDAIEAHSQATNPRQDDLADLHQELAETQIKIGHLDSAEASLRTALALQESRLGQQHPFLSYILEDLGWLLVSQQRLPEAKALLERAIHITETAHGPSSAEHLRQGVAAMEAHAEGQPEGSGDSDCCSCCDQDPNSLEAEVEALQAAGELEAAVARARSAVADRQRRDGPDAPSVVAALELLGNLLWSADAKGAIDAYEQRIAILKRSKASSDEEQGRLADSVGYLYSTLQQYEEAETWRIESVEKLSRSAPGTQLLADAVEDLAWTRVKLGKHADAVLDYELALDLWRHAVGEESRLLREKSRNLADAMARVERFDEAEEILLEQLDGLREAEPSQETWLDLERTYGSLHRLYKLAGRESDALEAERRRSALYDER
ncbi:MAG: tetratricopeptide repeat protein [Thermoanaerobaculia bacterium]|nr:tetratricopeptide repeat protein [Thermoanaerobaculia bacterium]